MHDNKGRHLPSILSALLRLVTDWTLDAALGEYRVFLPPEDDWVREKPGKSKKEKERVADLQVRFCLPALFLLPCTYLQLVRMSHTRPVRPKV